MTYNVFEAMSFNIDRKDHEKMMNSFQRVTALCLSAIIAIGTIICANAVDFVSESYAVTTSQEYFNSTRDYSRYVSNNRLSDPVSAWCNVVTIFSEYSNSNQNTIGLQLTEMYIGDAAWSEVYDENMWNRKPASDQQWILMKFFLYNLRGEELDASDIVYDCFYTTSGAKVKPVADATLSGKRKGMGKYDVSLFAGAATYFWIGILIPKSAGCPLMRIPNKVENCDCWIATDPNYIEPHTHSGGTATCSALAICTFCNQPYGSYNTNNHKYGDWNTDSEATCTVNGSKSRVCADCGNRDTQVINALGHIIIVDSPAVAATCTETGLSEASHCSRCNAILSEQKTISAKGHDFEEVTVNPTYEKDGKTYQKCKTCGFIQNEVSISTLKTPIVSISNNPGLFVIKYGEGVVLTATTDNLLLEYQLIWFVNGSASGTGNQLRLSSVKKNSKIEVKAVDKQNVPLRVFGNEVVDTEDISVQSGFFARLAFFFRQMFGIVRIHNQ